MTRDVGTTYKRALLRQSATERFRRLKAGSIGPDRLHRHVKRRCKMRTVPDFDSALKAMNERPKLLLQRQVLQFGEVAPETVTEAKAPDNIDGAAPASVAGKD